MERFILTRSQFDDENINIDTYILPIETCWNEIFLYWKQRIPEPITMEIRRINDTAEIIVGFSRTADFEESIWGSEKETLEQYNQLIDQEDEDDEED
jgi:hypothetical protein